MSSVCTLCFIITTVSLLVPFCHTYLRTFKCFFLWLSSVVCEYHWLASTNVSWGWTCNGTLLHPFPIYTKAFKPCLLLIILDTLLIPRKREFLCLCPRHPPQYIVPMAAPFSLAINMVFHWLISSKRQMCYDFTFFCKMNSALPFRQVLQKISQPLIDKSSFFLLSFIAGHFHKFQYWSQDLLWLSWSHQKSLTLQLDL